MNTIQAEANLEPFETSDKIRSLKQVRLGVAIEFAGFVLILLSIIAGPVIAIGRLPPLFHLVFRFISLSGAILMVLGPIACLTVPEEAQARKILMASIGGKIVNVAAFIIGYFYSESFGDIFQFILSIFSALGYIFFISFMAKIALYIQSRELQTEAQGFFAFAIFMLLGYIFIMIGAFFGIMIGAILIPFVALWMAILYLKLLAKLWVALSPT
ncbi:hypothetical protein [Gimesia fumaroli]|uniref:DUF996 domain-containing protein n=1 Tax=Gimesia fumaroli TaxID=2527976 RepID=A0A518I744_9PLAN|nr:hypothetical protein [Gimesia fumaroli]QDV48900.1 hypothetical protein Enr17x_09150 [Gimesia fumaroli]